jgi:hypothetical protein
MCIYYKDKENLTYKSEEHIFPAGIGGRATLPKGFVSDEFNNDISKLEQRVIRDSLISVMRVMKGPGKRGKLTEQSETKSEVCVFADRKNPKMYALGYVKKSKTIQLTQLYYDSKGHGHFLVSQEELENGIALFKEKCNKVDISKIRTIIDNELPIDIFLFGIAVNIEENYEYFFAKNSSNPIILTENVIKQIGDGINTEGHKPLKITYQPTVSRSVSFMDEDYRIYAKMAFNYLALAKGKEYVMSETFDPIRNWIAYGGKNEFAILVNSVDTQFLKLGINFPESSHVIVILNKSDGLWAKLWLYKNLCIDVRLSETSHHSIMLDGFICNWKERKEHQFLEYLNLIGKVE